MTAREKIEIFVNRGSFVDPGIVRHETRDPAHFRRFIHDRKTADRRIPALRQVQGCQDAHRRRLAGAIWTDESKDLPAIDTEGNIVDCAEVAELPNEAMDFKHRGVHGWPPVNPTTR